MHAFFGALVGAFLGFRLWGRSSEAFSTSWLPGLAYIGGGALVVGFNAGLAAESGWTRGEYTGIEQMFAIMSLSIGKALFRAIGTLAGMLGLGICASLHF